MTDTRLTESCMIYATAPTAEEAGRIARILVEEKHVACVNLIHGAAAVYRWQGKVEEAIETILIAKTTKALAGNALMRIEALHSHDVPCAVVYDMAGGLPGYLAWIARETA
jgi:periplasmic divalent cation tolerance protein